MKNLGTKRNLITLTAGFVILTAMFVTVQTYLSSPGQRVLGVETKAAPAANFTSGTQTAAKHGTHEIVLSGSCTASNLFDSVVTVSFTPPSGQSKIVGAFYDGNNIWKARVYVTETGDWSWRVASNGGCTVNSSGGSFSAEDSTLRGMLRKNSRNNKAWMTDDGRTFLNLSDTAYFFFTPSESRWQRYAQDLNGLGVTSFRSDALGGALWNMYWTDAARTQFNLTNWQNMDARIQWLLNTYPNMYVQVKLLPGPSDYRGDETVWQTLSQSVRDSLLKYMVSRWAGYPNLFFEITNDTRCSAYPNPPYTSTPANTLNMASEVGNYFNTNDPWQRLMSFGPTRTEPFCFSASTSWVDYVNLENAYALSADQVSAYNGYQRHVFNEEDYYEQDGYGKSPANPRYFYRRLFWAWLLSGGSANYGGRYTCNGSGQPKLQPYTLTNGEANGELSCTLGSTTFATQLVGLDSVRYIKPYFESRNIDLAGFASDDGLVSDVNGATGVDRLKLARRSTSEYLIYHPNSTGTGQNVNANSARTAAIRVNLSSATGNFTVEWFRPYDGISQSGGTVSGGAVRDFVAPWGGQDVVLRLLVFVPTVTPTTTPTAIPTPTPTPAPSALSPVGWWKMDEGSGTTAADSSGNGYTGTLTGGLWTLGKYGQALSLNGSSDYISVTSFSRVLSSATITAWIKSGSYSACKGVVFSRGTSVTGMNAGACSAGTRLGYHWNNDPNTYNWTGGPVIPVDEWVFVAMAVEPAKATAYVGSLSGLVSAVNTITHNPTTLNSLKFGQDSNGGGRFFAGQIDEVRIYDYALTPDQITALYNSGGATPTPTPTPADIKGLLSAYATSQAGFDMNNDGKVNSFDFAISAK